MSTLFSPGRDRTWLLAVATVCLSLSVAIGRQHGGAWDFVAGVFLGVALAVSLGSLVLALAGRAS